MVSAGFGTRNGNHAGAAAVYASMPLVHDMIGLYSRSAPFVRTLLEAKTVTDLLAENGLKRGDERLEAPS